MKISAETIDLIGGIDVGSHNRDSCPHAGDISILRTVHFDQLLIFIKELMEHVFGMHIGFVVGGLFGFCAGNIYADSYKPLFCSGLSELRQWRLMPYEFAKYGAIIGLIGGAILIALITRNSISRNVGTSCEDEVTEQANVAQAW